MGKAQGILSVGISIGSYITVCVRKTNDLERKKRNKSCFCLEQFSNISNLSNLTKSILNSILILTKSPGTVLWKKCYTRNDVYNYYELIFLAKQLTPLTPHKQQQQQQQKQERPYLSLFRKWPQEWKAGVRTCAGEQLDPSLTLLHEVPCLRIGLQRNWCSQITSSRELRDEHSGKGQGLVITSQW